VHLYERFGECDAADSVGVIKEVIDHQQLWFSNLTFHPNKLSGTSATVIEATLNYLLSGDQPPMVWSAGPGAPETSVGSALDPRTVPINDGRPMAQRASLDEEAFKLIRRPTTAKLEADSSVRSDYLPEVEALVRQETGAARVLAFDPTRRSSAKGAFPTNSAPVFRVHNDFTDAAARQTVLQLLPCEAHALLRRRVAILQLWRPLRRVVESVPLAIADARSLAPDHFVIARRYYPGWIGEHHLVVHDVGHRWYWIPRMSPNEALLFKVYDSAIDGRSRCGAHSAFMLSADSPPRESLEVRVLAFF